MITSIMIVYIICALGAYTIFNKYLIAINKETGEKLDSSNPQVYIFLLISKVCFSIAWIISLPIACYIAANKK